MSLSSKKRSRYEQPENARKRKKTGRVYCVKDHRMKKLMGRKPEGSHYINGITCDICYQAIPYDKKEEYYHCSKCWPHGFDICKGCSYRPAKQAENRFNFWESDDESVSENLPAKSQSFRDINIKEESENPVLTFKMDGAKFKERDLVRSKVPFFSPELGISEPRFWEVLKGPIAEIDASNSEDNVSFVYNIEGSNGMRLPRIPESKLLKVSIEEQVIMDEMKKHKKGRKKNDQLIRGAKKLNEADMKKLDAQMDIVKEIFDKITAEIAVKEKLEQMDEEDKQKIDELKERINQRIPELIACKSRLDDLGYQQEQAQSEVKETRRRIITKKEAIKQNEKELIFSDKYIQMADELLSTGKEIIPSDILKLNNAASTC